MNVDPFLDTSIEWIDNPLEPIDEDRMTKARARQNSLTKPPGSLGMLETIAIRLAGMQGLEAPDIKKPAITVFAADHGVARHGVSAFPQSVTAEMVRNFSAGGAAISVLARSIGARLEVVNVGTMVALEAMNGVVDQRIAAGTADMMTNESMSEAQFAAALNSGRAAVERAHDAGADLFIGGDMGIANTTSATAIACALLDLPAGDLSGPGTGLNADGVRHKATVITRALVRHSELLKDPFDALRCLGGFEIAALAGAWIRCAQVRMPMVIDGFISSVAALVVNTRNPDIGARMFHSHRSAEPGHRKVLEAMCVTPLVDFGMRLGEGSGAAVVVPLMRLACELHNHMATFSQAGVSDGSNDST